RAARASSVTTRSAATCCVRSSSTASPATRPSTSPSPGSPRSWSAPGRRSSRPRRTEPLDDRRAEDLVSTPRPRVRPWRRTLRALALEGRARAARSGTDERARNLAEAGTPGGDTGGAADGTSGADGVLHLSPGPHATALALDRGPLTPPVLLRPR